MATHTPVSSTVKSLIINVSTPGVVSLLNLPANVIVGPGQLFVTTPFDGTPRIQVGITADANLVFDGLTDIDYDKVGANRFRSESDHRILTPTVLGVIFTLGGATVGVATLTVKITRET